MVLTSQQSKQPEVRRVLHFAHGIGSYNNSLVEMLARFKKAGISVIVASHIDLSKVLCDSGVEFVHLSNNQAISDQYQADLLKRKKRRSPAAFLSEKFTALRLQRLARRQSLRSREIQNLIAHHQPGLLLVDMECHFALLASRASVIPTLLCSRWFSVFRSLGLPPMHTGLMPAVTRLQSWVIKFAWWRLWCYKGWINARDRFSRRRFRPVRYDSVSGFDLTALAKELGLDLARLADWRHWQIPHVYRGLPVMSLTLRELEFREACDPRMHYVGPMVSRANTANPTAVKGSRLLADFLSRPSSQNKPLVYCSLSSYWVTESDHLQCILGLFARRQEINLVVGLGGKPVPTGFEPLPQNILLLEYAPQIEVLEHADIAISHGGISTINESIYSGVPLIICSAGHVDQNGCMARVVFHQVGFAAQTSPLREDELEGMVDKLLENGDSVRENVQKLRQKILRLDESDAAVKTVLSFFENKRISS